jgi:hypothetical protein
MLALVTLFLATLLIAAVAVWLYRAISGWQGFNTTVVARRRTTVRMKLKPQQGYISILTPSRSRVKAGRVSTARLRRATGTIKAPWGW